MANVKISQLPAAGAITGNETVPLVQTGITSRATVNQITAAAVAVANTKVASVSAAAPLASSGGLTPTISFTGVLAAANGGTGLASPGAFGNALVSNGAAWVSAPVVASGGQDFILQSYGIV